MNVGLVVGKFCPLHKGHELVINTALQHCDRVIILSYTSTDYGFSSETRHYWLRKLFPMADILVLQPDEVPNDDASDVTQRDFCSRILQESGLPIPDAVFSSENYGDGFAEHLGMRFGKKVFSIMVDSVRVQIPTSGTKIRADLKLTHEFCSKVVQDSIDGTARRVLFIGAEGSGKTTIAKRYSVYSGNPYIPEFGRSMWELKHGILTTEDYTFIGKMQVELEELESPLENNIVCDTSPLVTEFYSNKFLGRSSGELRLLATRKYDYTFFCENDFGYIDDGTRNGIEFAKEQREFYLKRLKPGWISLSGSIENRLSKILTVIEG